jgi:hypothetical protein
MPRAVQISKRPRNSCAAQIAWPATTWLKLIFFLPRQMRPRPKDNLNKVD